MLSTLFGRPGRVFLRPGQDVAAATLARHRRRHPPVPGERLYAQTEHFIIYSDGSADGDAAAAAMQDAAEADYAAIQSWASGIIPPRLPFKVYTDPAVGGAYHITCAGTDIHVLPDAGRAAGFLAAEVVEVFEAALRNGWDCGHTNGEGLSRVLAFERHPDLASDFTPTEQDWWAAGQVDYVTDNSADDRDQVANGCADLFLYYLHSQLTFGWTAVVSAGGSSLGDTYQRLTGYAGAQGFSDFISVLTRVANDGTLALPPSGNPFPIAV